MKRMVLVILSILMLSCNMSIVTWADDSDVEPIDEQEIVIGPVNASINTSYGTRNTAYTCNYYPDTTMPGMYGCYNVFIRENNVSYDDGCSIWLKITAKHDNSIIHFEKNSTDMIKNMQVYKGSSTSVYQAFDKTQDPVNDEAYSWKTSFKANKGEVFYIKVDLAYYYGTFDLLGDDGMYMGLGTSSEPYKLALIQNDGDEYEYEPCGYIDKSYGKVWYSVAPEQKVSNVSIAIEDYSREIDRVEVYKGAITSEAVYLKYDSYINSWVGNIKKCSKGELVYIRVVYKSGAHEGYDSIRATSNTYYGMGEKEDPFLVYFNFAEYDCSGAYDLSDSSHDMKSGDNWIKYTFSDAGWFVWEFDEATTGVVDSITLYDSKGNLIKNFKDSTVKIYDGVTYHVYRSDMRVSAGDSYLVRLTFKRASEKVYFSHGFNWINAEFKNNKNSYEYTGYPIKPLPVVKDCVGNTLVKDIDYQLSYSNNIGVGWGTVTVMPIGKYSYEEKWELPFTIKPKKTSLKKITSGRKSFKVSWAKQSTKMKTARINGYQIQYSTSGSFKSGNKLKTVKGYSTTSTTIKKLKSNKKYYVRVRTYKIVDDDKLYSPWSAKKYVKTK